jgi:hypothetical protein
MTRTEHLWSLLEILEANLQKLIPEKWTNPRFGQVCRDIEAVRQQLVIQDSP